jgi:hypothetical protein
MSNHIGKRGENIFSTIISRYVPTAGFMLDPTFLGEKFPSVDFHVDLLNYPHKKGFFFASVKTTTRGYNADQSRLKITVDKDEIAELNKFPVPVYLFGIDENEETGFFLNANSLDNTHNLNGIPVDYPVNLDNIERLWKEVANYWDNNNEITKFVSHFK